MPEFKFRDPSDGDKIIECDEYGSITDITYASGRVNYATEEYKMQFESDNQSWLHDQMYQHRRDCASQNNVDKIKFREG